ncbi:MAG TPA: hypothetical protein VG273_07730 [Bryobacteraceae bacterium]|nr:hypothetical protein [Bryobacteraceae bacterium]
MVAVLDIFPMIARISIAFGVLFAGASLASPDPIKAGVVWDFQDGGFRSVSLVGEEYFGIDVAKKLLVKYADGASRLLKVLVYPTAEDGSLLDGKAHTDVTYSDWDRMYYARHGHESLRAMEIITTGQDAVVRIADRGRLSRIVMRGKDPTIIHAGGHEAEILTVSFHRRPRSIWPDGKNPIFVIADLRVDSLPTDSQALEIMRATKHVSGRLRSTYPFAQIHGSLRMSRFRSGTPSLMTMGPLASRSISRTGWSNV